MTVDLSGQRFGKLSVTDAVDSRQSGNRKRRFWLCICDCGRQVWVCTDNLRSGNSTKCFYCDRGTHGQSLKKGSIYRIWATMLSRCRNPNDDGYYLYGARGISVCERWLKFENFFADMGDRPSPKHSIDRYPNPAGNYEPSNCRWATPKEQAENRKTTRLTYEKADNIRNLFKSGRTKTEIARTYNVSFSAVARVIDGSRWVRT